MDNSHLHVEATQNLLFCVAVRVARTICLCNLPQAHICATFTVHSDVGPSLLCSGPIIGNAGNNGWSLEAGSH